MRLEQLEFLVEVARTGTISATAEKLHLTQPNISQSIASLEEELGVQLLKRSRTGSKLTSAGESIMYLALEIFNKLDEIKDIANIHSTMLTGSLTIAATPTVCTSLLPKSLAIFKNKFPEVEVKIIEEESNHILDEVMKGNIDLGLIGFPKNRRITTKHIEIEHFLHSKILACVGKNSIFARNKMISLKEIIQYPILSSSKYVLDKLSQFGKPNLLFESKNIEASKRAIAEGMATGFYTDLSLKYDPYMHMGEIIPIPLKESLEIIFSCVYLKKKKSPEMIEFYEEFKKQLNHFEQVYRI